MLVRERRICMIVRQTYLEKLKLMRDKKIDDV